MTNPHISSTTTNKTDIIKRMIICCLGNPGSQYTHTRHNIGFRVGDSIINAHNLTKVGNKFKSILYEGQIGNKKVRLIQPQTYMNLSGEAVVAILQFYKLDPKDLVVIYDDIDIEFETMRLREKGSAGTHNGMRSIIGLLGNNAFPRLRMGVGPIPENIPIKNFVLGNFTKIEEDKIPNILERASTVISTFITQDYQSALNLLSKKP